MSSPSPFNTISIISLLVMAFIGGAAYTVSKTLLPKNTSAKTRLTFLWLTFDALTHFTIEGPFLYMSVFGRQVNTSSGIFAMMWREYAASDFRWGNADPTIVSLEILTTLIAGPMCCYILKQLIDDDPARHYWIVVLSTAELYGTWMTFCPEWLTGSPNLDTSNFLYLWVYLFLLNVIWAVVPIWLMYDSYHSIAKAMRSTHTKVKSA